MNVRHTSSILFGILAVALLGITSCRGPGPVRRADHREDRRDYLENRIDESYNRGPLDRREDKLDRREDRWDRRGF